VRITVMLWSVLSVPFHHASFQSMKHTTDSEAPSSRRHAEPSREAIVHTPCLDAECVALLKQYESSGDADVADHLIESLDAARRVRWEEATEKLDFSHSSRKGWNLVRRLGPSQ
jgi:hypothetical protein